MGRFSKLELEDKKAKKEELLTPAEPIEEGYNQDYYFAQAEEYYRKGEYEKALRYYSRALGIDNTLVPAWVGQVKALLGMGEYREAHVWVNKALELFPGESELLAAKSVVYCRLGMLKQAIGISDLSLEQKAPTAYCWLARGQVFLCKRSRNAQFCFDKAIELTQNDWFMNQQVALAYFEAGQYNKALTYFSNAASKNSQSPYLWYMIGLCNQKLGFYTRAIQCYQQALELDPIYKPAVRAWAKVNRTKWFARLFFWIISPFRK
ncbi:MAG: tetratricopeptide repeat protein [bacterium]|nr:tetratricopeptide repeat protein [bacterium]